MSARLVNCVATEKLSYPSYFRATFEATIWAGFENGMKATLQRIPSTELAVPTHGNPVVPGSKAAVVDLRILAEARAATVADLARALESLAMDTKLATLERIAFEQAYGARSERERDAATVQEEQQNANGGIGAQFQALIKDVRNFVLILAIGALVFYAVKVRAIARIRRAFK